MLMISSFILWIGCLLVYISSPQQKLLPTPISKVVSYPIFLVLVLTSWFALSQEYSGVIAAIVALSLIMVMWPTSVFIVGQIKPRAIPYIVSGTVFFSLLSVMGGV